MAEKNESGEKPVVRVSRVFTASPEEVFDAWLDQEQLAMWMFGPNVRDEEIIHLHVDAQVGGKFSFLVRRGEMEIDHVGTYRAIERPRRLVFTWGIVGNSADESVVTIGLRAVDGGCELQLTHEMDPKWADYADRTQQGWTMMVDKLADVLAARA